MGAELLGKEGRKGACSLQYGKQKGRTVLRLLFFLHYHNIKRGAFAPLFLFNELQIYDN
jgi:hypothetical protein